MANSQRAYVKRWVNNINGKQVEVEVYLARGIGKAFDKREHSGTSREPRSKVRVYAIEEVFESKMKAIESLGEKHRDWYLCHSWHDVAEIKAGFYILRGNGRSFFDFKGERRHETDSSFPSKLLAMQAVAKKIQSKIKINADSLEKIDKKYEKLKKSIEIEALKESKKESNGVRKKC